MTIESSMPTINPAILNELDLIIATIKTNTTPESIYLFGSYANGVPNNDSDIDIYLENMIANEGVKIYG